MTPVPPLQPTIPGAAPALNWSHFKSKIAGNLDEDAKAYYLRTNDWMDTHTLPEDVKVQSSKVLFNIGR